jgi:hypothetical protein
MNAIWLENAFRLIAIGLWAYMHTLSTRKRPTMAGSCACEMTCTLAAQVECHAGAGDAKTSTGPTTTLYFRVTARETRLTQCRINGISDLLGKPSLYGGDGPSQSAST